MVSPRHTACAVIRASAQPWEEEIITTLLTPYLTKFYKCNHLQESSLHYFMLFYKISLSSLFLWVLIWTSATAAGALTTTQARLHEMEIFWTNVCLKNFVLKMVIRQLQNKQTSTTTENCTLGSSNIVSASAWFMIRGKTRRRRQGTRSSASNNRRQLDKSANKKDNHTTTCQYM